MNINEIAKLAGVSRATVSRYLNDGYVSEEKRKIIREVIENTGYQPSAQAQNLRKNVTGLIGVIIPRIQSESVSRMVAGISVVLSEAGYQMLLANTQNNEKEELKYLKIFRKNQVDGVILMGTMFSKAHFALIKELDIPIVILGQQAKGYSCVYQDDYHAANEAAELLTQTGKKIGFIGVTARDRAVGYQRKKGFQDKLKEKGIKIEEKGMAEADFGLEAGYEATKTIMEANPDIDSLFCATDNIAIGALKRLHEIGKSVPKEVQLLGLGDNTIGRIVEPSITTVHFYYKTSGEEAARLLLEILGSGEDLKKEIKMGFRLKVQESTRKR